MLLDECAEGDEASNWQIILDDRIEVGDIVGYYRLDDDDVLASNYFDRLEEYRKPPFVGMVVSFAAGYTAVWDGHRFVCPRRVHSPMLALGIAYVCKKVGPKAYLAPSQAGGHNLADRVNPVILDSREPGYFWTRSPEQDTTLNVKKEDRVRELVDVIRGYDAIDEDAFRREFPTMDIVASPEIMRLVDSDLVLGREQGWDLPSGTRSFSIILNHLSYPGTHRRNYLVSFEVRDLEGNKVTSDIDAPGMTVSGNPNVLHFRYIPMRPGQQSLTMPVTLPPGLVCSRITIREWQKPQRASVIQRLEVELESEY